MIASNSVKITQAYTQYILENGQKPASVFSFCKLLSITENDFYEEFSTFEHVEAAVWKMMFENTLTKTKAEKVYEGYSAREKLLAVYFTWVEVLKSNRSFILATNTNFKKPLFMHKNAQLVDFKTSFYDFANALIMEATENQEIEKRAIPQIMQRYPDLFWSKTLYILDFWMNDTSKLFEKTDTLIEKTVNTSFDLLARSPLDSLFDLGKFIFQNRK